MRARAFLAVALIGLSFGCGTGTPSSGSSPTPTPPRSSAPTPTTSPTASPTPTEQATAARALASFFAAVDRQDARLRTAARLVNGSIGATRASFSSSTVAAVRATEASVVARAIPAGLPADLLRAVLVVDSDLVGRSAAMTRVLEVPDRVALGSEEGKDLLRCLGNGSVIAARFGADVAAAQSLARRLPAVTVASPRSRAGLEVAVRAAEISLGHRGCDACGSTAPPRFPTVRYAAHQDPGWGTTARGWTRFGTIGELPFRARWVTATRTWQVDLLAC